MGQMLHMVPLLVAYDVGRCSKAAEIGKVHACSKHYMLVLEKLYYIYLKKTPTKQNENTPPPPKQTKNPKQTKTTTKKSLVPLQLQLLLRFWISTSGLTCRGFYYFMSGYGLN